MRKALLSFLLAEDSLELEQQAFHFFPPHPKMLFCLYSIDPVNF
uniref:Uncharacterized protein n=1 Tax=Utricularia reniformis TaxID=192314 RepID=A0A1Y0B050_9LAMI|nr:hypothetical protein AEK19_MT0557 [Utricularia reniformis]ART30812.1 hypothetical protein AEK19_MT0557 [Utricularia reniformis]